MKYEFVIVVVRWYIKPGREKDFKETWEKMIPDTMDGLFREFFSRPHDAEDEKYHTLDFESKHYQTFINVGVWKSLKDFDNAIGSKIPKRKQSKAKGKSNKEFIELFDFEHKLRERLVMNVEETRGGKWILPDANF